MNHLSVLVKPASSVCNLECSYCFYHDVSEHREIASYGIMEEVTADALIDKVFKHIKSPGTVTFMFQGGEPCMAGLAYYEHFLKKADVCCPKEITVEYSIQTNGTLINDDWCRLFKEYNFLVGLSQDGPAAIHDKLRYGHNKEKTHAMTAKTIELFRVYEIKFNILIVISKEIARNATRVYEYYKMNNIDHLQFIPCLAPLDQRVDSDFSLSAREYGRFLKELFENWFSDIKKGRYISIRTFDNLVWMLRGRYPEMCGLDGKCHVQFVIEADGSVYPCDFYVLDQYKSGNIKNNTLAEILSSPRVKVFEEEKCPVHSLCGDCKVKALCHGGCRRHRSLYLEEEGYCPNQDFLYNNYEKLVKLV